MKPTIVFDYLEYRAFLKDMFLYRKEVAASDAVFEVSDTPLILPGFIGNRIYLFHPGG